MTETVIKNLRDGWIERALLRTMLVVAFAMSAKALHEVGMAAGLSPALAAGVPILIDGFAVLAARVITRLDRRTARLYPWVLLILLGALSVYANGIHAQPVTIGELTLTVQQAQLVAALPPVVLGLGFHLTTMVTTSDAKAEEANRRADERAANPRPGGRKRDPEAKARRIYQAATEEGRRISGSELGRLAGMSEAWGRTALKRLRTEAPVPELTLELEQGEAA